MAQRLEGYLNQFSEAHGESFRIDCMSDALALIEEYKPFYDIIFLDIELPYVDGMEAAKHIRRLDEDVILIFVTNMAQFAVKGYAVNALDYLIKPIRYEEFSKALERALALRSKYDETILVKVGGEMRRLLLRSILYLESSNHQIFYHLDQEVLEAWGTISDMENKLEGRGFLRCNVCYLVNCRHITAVQGYTVVLHDGTKLQISRQRKKTFMQELARLMGDENI